jgi:ATP-binding cassette, subfamily B, bacterial
MPETKSIKETVPGLGRIIHKFWPQIRKQNLLIVISFLALIAETVFRLLEPWPLKVIFDYILLSDLKPLLKPFQLSEISAPLSC